MHILVTYDVNTEDKAGRRRLRRIAKSCENYGQRVQFSIFEVNVNLTRWTELKLKLLDLMDDKKDSLRFYFLSSDDAEKTEHHGTKKPRDLDEPLIL
ncbi:MAG: CRISPR-associated endonuclease Cas2 [Planctomycetota bacterium]|nr:CRISPR-associated endonuclease Cas2 [Planctomycetota bacterium]